MEKNPQQPNINLPVVGVVIPNYNMQNTVVDAINSVILQDYPQKCVIVVDDCSEDNSWETIKDFVEDKECFLDQGGNETFSGLQDKVAIYGIRLGKHANQCNAKNIGVQSVGNMVNIFGFLDADDVYLGEKISKSVIEFLDNPEVVGMVYSDHIVETNGHSYPQHFRAFNRHEIYNTHYSHISFFVSALLLNKIGLFDVNLPILENYDMMLRAAEQSVLVHIPEPLSVVNIRSNGLMQNPPHHPGAVLNHILGRAQQRVNGKV